MVIYFWASHETECSRKAKPVFVFPNPVFDSESDIKEANKKHLLIKYIKLHLNFYMLNTPVKTLSAKFWANDKNACLNVPPLLIIRVVNI